MRLNKTSFIIIISAAIVSVLLFSVTIIFFPGYYSFLNSQHTEVCSDYDKEKRIIMVKCNSTLSEVGIALSDDNILKNHRWYMVIELIFGCHEGCNFNNRS